VTGLIACLDVSNCCRFEEACAAYSAGGRPELGMALLQQLADTAVLQCRFADAAHGYYKLAMASLEVGGALVLHLELQSVCHILQQNPQQCCLLLRLAGSSTLDGTATCMDNSHAPFKVEMVI
jgi:hypothetical protein